MDDQWYWITNYGAHPWRRVISTFSVVTVYSSSSRGEVSEISLTHIGMSTDIVIVQVLLG